MPLVLSLNLSCLQEPCQGLLVSLPFGFPRQSIGFTQRVAACGGQASVAWLKLVGMLRSSCMDIRQNQGTYFYSFSPWSFWWVSGQQKWKTSCGSANSLAFFLVLRGMTAENLVVYLSHEKAKRGSRIRNSRQKWITSELECLPSKGSLLLGSVLQRESTFSSKKRQLHWKDSEAHFNYGEEVPEK